MSYATPDQLADALEIRVTPDNQETLQDCLDAAAAEIDRVMADAAMAWPPTGTAPPLVVRTNVNRAVEWYKAPATYNGGIGFVDSGTMGVPKSGFERHAAVLYALTITGASGVA